MTNYKWIIVQNGAREHYALPRMFHKNNELLLLITDVWINPNNWLTKILCYFVPRLKNRYHPELKNAKIQHWTLLFLLIELIGKILKLNTYRDQLYEKVFRHYLAKHHFDSSYHIILFSYNYIANEIFQVAKSKGYYCVLGQIDAGPKAGEINQFLYKKYFNGQVKPNPDLYSTDFLEKWKKSCWLADKIVVNSAWSAQLIADTQLIDNNKIVIIPIAFEASIESTKFKREYPNQFSEKRPLKVVYVGSVKPLKGVIPLFEAINELKNYPIAFYFIGSLQIPRSMIELLPQTAIFLGQLSSQQIEYYYRNCDVLILPTFSDGFAMVQLEAQAWKLPLIVSKRCGNVITNHKNGIVLEDINKDEIIKSLIYLLNNPQQLVAFSDNSIDMQNYSLKSIYLHYTKLFT